MKAVRTAIIISWEFYLEWSANNGSALARAASLAQDYFMLPDEQTSPEQFAAYRAMTGAQRWKLAEGLFWSARKMKLAGSRSQHPDWSEERLVDEVHRIFLMASGYVSES